ncbi:MAG: hypothetical protein LBE22_10395 [Azoarcus sp.]|jgi:hypothetical protein|nr:hypothetical protein [Azoarcus sp.]
MPQAVALGIMAAVSAGSAYSQHRQASKQESAMKRQQSDSQKAAKAAEDAQAERWNRENQRQSSLLDFGDDVSATSLTGPGGISGGMPLGGNSLLGG